jgi:hypothetical protein
MNNQAIVPPRGWVVAEILTGAILLGEHLKDLPLLLKASGISRAGLASVKQFMQVAVDRLGYMEQIVIAYSQGMEPEGEGIEAWYDPTQRAADHEELRIERVGAPC